MDNLSRTEKDLRTCSVEYLTALKQELEARGTKMLMQLDSIEEDNKTLMKCHRMLKFVPKKQREAQKAQRDKQKEKQDMRKQELTKKREERMQIMPEVLNQKSSNLGVQAIRESVRDAWLNQSLGMLQKALESAKQLNTDEGLLTEEIKICEKEIEVIVNAKTERFREQVSEQSEKINFKLFQFERVLNNMPDTKTINLLGTLRGDPTGSKAIACLSKTEFKLEHVENINKKGEKNLEQEEYFHNDIFRKYWLRIGGDINKLQVNLVYPATETLINKYSKQEIYSVKETADIYTKITKPHFVDKVDPASYEWMQNVLDNKKETELCVFENEHFKLQKDYKFNEGDLSTLYLLAMPVKAPEQKLHSIRDLGKEHLPMLKSIQEESYKAIEQKYGLPKHKVYAYFHYLPTYYLLHVHFVNVDGQAMDKREMQPLEVVIQNIEMNAKYY